MNILLPVSGMAFAAFCVWLTVRIANRRERWAKWLAVGLLVGLPVLYIVGFGLTCRAIAVPLGGTVAPSMAMEMYWPLGAMAANRASSPGSVIRWYMSLWTSPAECVLIQTDTRGDCAAIFSP